MFEDHPQSRCDHIWKTVITSIINLSAGVTVLEIKLSLLDLKYVLNPLKCNGFNTDQGNNTA